MSNFNFGPVIPLGSVFPPGSTINHGNGWTTTTTPVFPGVPGGGHSITHYTGIYNKPTQPPTYNWTPPINRPWGQPGTPYKDVDHYFRENDLEVIDKKLTNVTKELEDSEKNVSYDFDDSLLKAEMLLVILNKLAPKNSSEALKKNVADFKLLIEQKNNLKKYIKNQESFRQEKIKDLAIKKISFNGHNMGNFLKYANSNKKHIFTIAFIESAKAVLGYQGDWIGVWNEYVVAPAMDLYNAKHELINVLNKITPAKEEIKTNTKKLLTTDNSMSGLGMFFHFTGKSGRELTLSEIGVHDRIRILMQKPNAFGRTEGSIQSRFISQIQNGERIDFKNGYDFAKESKIPGIDPLWAIGGATISGNLINIKAENAGDKYNISGVINYKLYDNFTDPYDTFNWKTEDINWGGEPFEITGEWQENVNFQIEKNIYENKIKPLIKQNK
ncbi:hypothetical protein CE143_09670 [Photorhabdus luminescens]|uniref:Uncharacterized protein n=1 Tax=Photorhabdus akhurstii TaxID=171438 RepID=A0ABX8LX14_9GAMM|nr:hypothetical protein [Photorhabdus akhurstii]MBS9426874.1 hypothetical protein [Photorhabdus akhurstii]QXF33392.1 hypothetical protein B0X70_09755 [Photorhabdus akhurstii]UJD75188.1 hypothetical protein CE143_09670 [Photorhabdus luminescens]